MKRTFLSLSVALAAGVSGHAQVAITADDMFNQVGLYYKAYSNPFDPTSTSPTPWAVPSGLIGPGGPSQVWDFSTGPTNVVYRFDYVSPTNVDSSITADFPKAQIIERQTNLSNPSQNPQYLFFSQVPGVGREVYGFYLDASLGLLDPSNPFQTPIVDFPSQITYGQQWTTVATYLSTVNSVDPTDPTSGAFGIGIQTVQTSDLKVDGWGTIVFPAELGGFAQGLRISEAVTIDTSYDDGSGSYQQVETDYARNYYWLVPGRGIVASLASTQSANPPPDQFTAATQFWRMFETNKKATPPPVCTDPAQVTDLSILYSSGQVLLKWSKVQCASQYQLEYSDGTGNPLTWQTMGVFTNQLYSLDNAKSAQTRFYRVVSIK